MTRLFVVVLVLLSGACATVPSQQMSGPPDPHPQVLLQTTLGDIRLELDRERAPISVDNFLRYLGEKHYDGTIFHRVIAGFVVQGGGFDTAYGERPNHEPIKLESGNGLSNLRGTLAMAREEEPNTATSEFYVNLVDNLKLDPHPENPARKWGYAVFGKVIGGMDVVDAIAGQTTGAVGPFEQDAPLQNIVLLKATPLPRQ